MIEAVRYYAMSGAVVVAVMLAPVLVLLAASALR